MSSDDELSRRQDTITKVIDAVRPLFEDDLTYAADLKDDGTIVTALDGMVQKSALAVLQQEHPDEPVWAEEDDQAPTHEVGVERVRWALDPIDGTTNFARSVPLYAVSVAAVRGRQPLVGAIWHVSADQVHWSTSAPGWGGEPPNELSMSVAMDYEGSDRNRLLGAEVFREAVPRFRSVRVIGTTALGLAWTAAGLFDVFFHPLPKIWDYAAGGAMILAAGGRVLSPEIGESAPYLLAGHPDAVAVVQGIVERVIAATPI